MLGQPKKIGIRITDRSDMSSDVCHGCYTTNQTNKAILAEKMYFDAILLDINVCQNINQTFLPCQVRNA